MISLLRVTIPERGSRSYTVRIQCGLFESLSTTFQEHWKGKELFIIADSTVAALYGRSLLRALWSSGVSAWLLDFPPGERSKTANTIYNLHTQLLAHGVQRDSLIVALGGGVVGDVAGFVAATVLRGVEYVHVPTTLLAQVDSSIGGKVGVDHPYGKNLIGAFHQPAAVFTDPCVLRTLNAADFRNGLAEIVKIAAALDKAFFRDIERHARKITKNNSGVLRTLIAHAVGLKASVVRKDERDMGLRRTLNLGHTLGHACEAASGYRLPHGAAVAMGLAGEAHIAVIMGLLAQRDFRRLVNLLAALKLPTKIPRALSRPRILAALELDKKVLEGRPRFVLLKGIGHSVLGVEVPTPFILEALS
jgi:3-dehydroquinate synthase